MCTSRKRATIVRRRTLSTSGIGIVGRIYASQSRKNDVQASHGGLTKTSRRIHETVIVTASSRLFDSSPDKIDQAL
jgi:hypothetical protein